MDLTHSIKLVPGAGLVRGKVPRYTTEKRAFENEIFPQKEDSCITVEEE